MKKLYMLWFWMSVCLSKKEGQIKSLCNDTEMELILNYIIYYLTAYIFT